MLIALMALSIFSLLGLYGVFNATMELKMSDNYESQVQASYAAKAGINHARELLKGLQFNDLLKGPDGTTSGAGSYIAQAKTYTFRNFVDWATARSLDITNPASAVSGIPDDGLINTGKFGATNGTILIPSTGIAFTATNSYGAGTITTARYFVKVTDNNGEARELLGDPADNPFFDGDGEVIIRSVGIAQTIRETAGSSVRRNSVAVYEARFRQRSTFDLDAPMVLQGNGIQPSSSNMYNGNSFDIDGGSNNPGIATIDPNISDSSVPSTDVTSPLAKNQEGNIRGTGPEPSISNITGAVSADEDKSRLLDPNYLYNFVNNVAPLNADATYSGNQSWSGGSAPDIGSFDPSKPLSDPSQNPKLTIVNGDLSVSGNITGGGVLIITGKFSGSGSFSFNGIILVIGKGEIDMSGMNVGLNGGIYGVNVQNIGGTVTFGPTKMSIGGNSDIIINSQALNMGVSLLPASQVGWREVSSVMDP